MIHVHRSVQRRSLSKAYAIATAMNEVTPTVVEHTVRIIGYEVDFVYEPHKTQASMDWLIDVIYEESAT